MTDGTWLALTLAVAVVDSRAVGEAGGASATNATLISRVSAPMAARKPIIPRPRGV
jgi:hypothetical protein